MNPTSRLSARLSSRLLGPLLAGLLVFATGLAGAQPASAPGAAPVPSRLDDIVRSGRLRVGTTGDYLPFTHRVDGGRGFVGLDIALAAELARTLGVDLELVPTTWPTLMRDFAAGRFDLAVGGITVTLARQKTALFSTPYLRDGKTPLVRCEDVDRYPTLARIDQPGVRVIVNPGGTNEGFDRAHLRHATLVVNADNLSIFDRLAAGGADVMITDAIEARLQARLHPALCAVHPDAPFDFSEKAFLLPRDFVLKAYVDEFLRQQLESGDFERLETQWLAYPWALEPLRRLIDQRLMLAPDVARYKWNHHLPIEDARREDEIVTALGRRAVALGLPEAWVQAFFRAQIEASKAVQGELFKGWDVFKRDRLPGEVDLATVTRPRLDRIDAQLLEALARNWPVLSDSARRDDVARALVPMAAQDLNPQAAAIAVAPLVH